MVLVLEVILNVAHFVVHHDQVSHSNLRALFNPGKPSRGVTDKFWVGGIPLVYGACS